MMSFDEIYEAWKREHHREEAPPGLADAVMARLPEAGPRRMAWLGSVSRVAACLLAGAVCVFRAAHVLGLFLPG